MTAFNNLVVELPLLSEANELRDVLGSIVPSKSLGEIKESLPYEGIGIKQLLLASKMAMQKASEENKQEVNIEVLKEAIRRVSRFKL